MASARFASPPFSSQPREPATPDPGLRNRATSTAGHDRTSSQQTPGGGAQAGDASPTSSTISNFSASRLGPGPGPDDGAGQMHGSPPPSRSLLRPLSALGTPVAAAAAAAAGVGGRRATVRADPALVTCFEPSDPELYALWAPRA